MNTYVRRLEDLERRIPEPGCPVCSVFPWTTGIAFLVHGEIDVEADTLSEDAEFDRPEHCPACGTHHPIHTAIGGGLSWDAV